MQRIFIIAMMFLGINGGPGPNRVATERSNQQQRNCCRVRSSRRTDFFLAIGVIALSIGARYCVGIANHGVGERCHRGKHRFG